MRHRYLFVGICIVLGIACVRLGLWQLDRRADRRAYNSGIEMRTQQPALELEDLPADTGVVRYRRSRITGIADYDQELILGNRSRAGAPGVNLLTPVRVAGSDTAVLVNRGWVYSPDAASAPAGSWREADTVTFEGYIDLLGPGPAAAANVRRPRLIPMPVLASAQARLPYPVAPLYLVALQPQDSGRAGIPARLELPRVTDEGPHLGYAMQWFIFATVAFVGAGIALKAGHAVRR